MWAGLRAMPRLEFLIRADSLAHLQEPPVAFEGWLQLFSLVQYDGPEIHMPGLLCMQSGQLIERSDRIWIILPFTANPANIYLSINKYIILIIIAIKMASMEPFILFPIQFSGG